jgi:MFS transporter, FSR family, fosmidomycin resistance protein
LRPHFFLAASLRSGWLFVVVLAIGGFFLQSTLPVNVIFGQQLARVSAATVSSLMMGFAWGMGGVSVPIVGAFADRWHRTNTARPRNRPAARGGRLRWPRRAPA